MIKTYDVPVELTTKIEKLQYDLAGLKDLIAFLVSNTVYSVPEDRIMKLQSEIVDINAKYEKAKLEVENIFKNDFDNTTKLDWNLDFTTSVVTVEY